jgi:Lipocalin-like domain
VNQLTDDLEKVRYDPNRAATDGGDCIQPREGNHARHATTKGGEPLANTPGSSDASPPIISYSGNYRLEGNDLAAKVDLVWEDGWPRTDELHHYRLDGDKRLVETTHVRYPNAFGSRMISILVWERE